MKNILVIKHGALGDVVQISGVLQDIRRHYHDRNIVILTTKAFQKLFSLCPYIDEVMMDERRPGWNLPALFALRAAVRGKNFSQVIDLQNSSRTEFYRKHIFGISAWSSTRTILQADETKLEFDRAGVLERFRIQLERSGIPAAHTLHPDFSWAVDTGYDPGIGGDYIFIAPFSSTKSPHKRWPHYQQLIALIRAEFPGFEFVLAPAPSELESARQFDARVALHQGRATDFSQLARVIQGARYVIANDTGPAHMAAHLGCRGLVLFGSHTSPEQTSIETGCFRALQAPDLSRLAAHEVFQRIAPELRAIARL